MSVAADNYRVITDTLSNLKRILLIDDDPAQRSKRVHLSPLHQSALASSLSEVVHPVIAGSATGNAGAASTATVESVEQDLEQGGGSSDEIHNGHSSIVLLSSSPDIHIELSQEECESSGKQKEGAMMRMEENGVEDGSVVLTSASVVATDPIARNEEPIVLEEVTIRKRETTPLKELEVSIDTIPLEEPMTSKDAIPLEEPMTSIDTIPLEEPMKSKDITALEEPMTSIDTIPLEEPMKSKDITALEEPMTSIDTIPLEEPETSKDVTALEEPETSKDTIPLKEPEMRKEALQKESEQKDAALTDHSLSLEERMEQILTTMDHQITSSDQARAAFRPPRISPPSPRPSPTLSISRLLFVYINHRGCAVAFPPSHHA